MRKNQEQLSTSSRDIPEVDQPSSLSEFSLWLDQPATSSGKKGSEISYYCPKLSFIISPKFVLPIPQIRELRPEKRAYKRKRKIVVIASSLCKSKLEMGEKERTIKLQEETTTKKKLKKRLLRNLS